MKRGPAPAWIACLALVAIVAALVRASLGLTGGRLVYPLDDAYIHMAVARNLAEHGVWGVTRHAFTSSTSSLAWPLLLAAADALFRASEALPLALNLAAGIACVAIAAVALRGGDRRWSLAVLLALVALTPLPTLVVAGMEHTLHVAAALWLALLVARTADGSAPAPRAAALAVASGLAAMLRYESLFLAAAAFVVLAAQRRVRQGLVVVAAAAVPLVLYALLSMERGWYPLPNSVLLKGAHFDPSTLAGVVDLAGGRSLRMLGGAPHLLVLVAACLGLLAFAGLSRAALPALAAITTLLHLQFADVGWLYRYEAWLVALGIVAFGVVAPDVLPALRAAFGDWRRSAATVALAAIVAFPLVERAARAAAETPRAARNIHDQQYQMGLFLRRFYTGASVAANDIGAISYLADVHLVDLYGLGSMDVARARRAGTLDRATLARIAAEHGTEVAVVYRSWFAQSLPAGWLEAGSWRAPEKVVVADRVVTFFAADVPGRDRLTSNLRAFAGTLPAEVEVRLPDQPPAAESP